MLKEITDLNENVETVQYIEQVIRWKKPTNAQGCCKQFIVLIKSPTYFGIQMPSSGGYLFLFKLLQF
jgi:hypothetical protein